MITIRQAATNYRVAEIQIWGLVRRNVIRYKSDRTSTFVDKAELSEYFADHPDDLLQWQQNFEHTQTSISKIDFE